MYGRPRTLNDDDCWQGRLRLGGLPGSGDPVIGLSVFRHSYAGQADALFSDSFEYDVRNRDFSCNAIYFDPFNNVYVDPTAHGIYDAEQRLLRLVADTSLCTRPQLGEVAIRFFGFLRRGFTSTADCRDYIAQNLTLLLSAMDAPVRLDCLRRQIHRHVSSPGESEAHLDALRDQFISLELQDAWFLFIEPLRQGILHEC
jgi:hypothetical protein